VAAYWIVEVDLFDYTPDRTYWLGWALAPFRLLWKAINLPISCERKDRPLVLVLWLLMFAAVAAPLVYFLGPAARSETLNYVFGSTGVLAIILIIWLGAWDNDLDDFTSNFENPLDPDSGGPYSGGDGRAF
jgi:hypothetical protein